MNARKDIDKIVNSLDGLQQAGPGPFFYTRVKARLQQEEGGVWGKLSAFITQPVVTTTTLCFIVGLNVAAFFYHKEITVSANDQNEQALTEDYNTTLAANSYYDENPESH